MRKNLFGTVHEQPTEPEEKGERLDLSRMVTYPTRSRTLAEGMFREKYGIAPSVVIEASIGGKTNVRAFTVGLIPLDWSEQNEP